MIEPTEPPANLVERTAQEAEALAFALESSCATLAEVKEWAYAALAMLPGTPDPLLELTNANLHPTYAVRHLRAFSGCRRDAETLKRLLRRLASALRTNPQRAVNVAQTLYGIALDDQWNAGGLRGAFYSFDDELELARVGVYGDPAEVTARMQVFLESAGEGGDAQE